MLLSSALIQNLRENTFYVARKRGGADFSPIKVNLFVFE